MYIFISEQDRIEKRTIVFDKQLNEEFQEALKYDGSLMIEERSKFIKKGWFGKTQVIPIYNLYHETPAYDGSAYQARFQFSGSGTKEIVIAYLHGLINGCVNTLDKIKNN